MEDDGERPVGSLPEAAGERGVGSRGAGPGNLIRAREVLRKRDSRSNSESERSEPNRENLPAVAQKEPRPPLGEGHLFAAYLTTSIAMRMAGNW